MCLRFPKPRPALLDKRERQRLKDAAWRGVSRRVRQRDKACRICHGPGFDVHHIVMRSLGGTDEASNLVFTCRTCHQDIHGHVLKLFGTATDLRWERISA